jgi:hypothetical protein
MNNFSVSYTSTSEISAVNAISATLKKGAAVQVVMFSETKMNKGNKTNRNPYLGRVMQRTTIGGWSVGTDYENSCNNAAERSGSEDKVETKENWHVRFNDFFNTDKKTGTKFYLQLQRAAKQGHTSDTQYFVDARPATDEEIAEIKVWMPKKKDTMSSTQTEAGVTKENERKYKLIALENIESITQGSFHYQIVKAQAKALAESTAK